jgi:hypothetical protein
MIKQLIPFGAAATAALAVALSATPSAAETVTTKAVADEEKAALPSGIGEAVGAATLDSAISLPEAVEIVTDEGASKVTVKLSYSLQNTRGKATYFSFKGVGPLEKAEDGKIISALKGLGNATSLEVGFNQTKLTGVHPMEMRTDEDFKVICEQVVKAWKAKPADAPADVDTPDCDKKTLNGTFVQAYAPKRYDDYLALYAEKDATFSAWGVSGALGSEKFDYRDPATLAELSDSKSAWSVSAYYSRMPLNLQTLFTIRGEHKRLYKLPDPTKKCRDPADAASCIEAAFGPPVKEDVDVVSFEMRRRVGDVGIAFSANYDVGEENLVLDLPVYFIRDGKDGFNGGVRATWDTKTDEAKVGVFINRAFTFFGGL